MSISLKFITTYSPLIRPIHGGKKLKFNYGQNKVKHVLIFSLNIQSIIFDKITTQSQSVFISQWCVKGAPQDGYKLRENYATREILNLI